MKHFMFCHLCRENKTSHGGIMCFMISTRSITTLVITEESKHYTYYNRKTVIMYEILRKMSIVLWLIFSSTLDCINIRKDKGCQNIAFIVKCMVYLKIRCVIYNERQVF